MLTKILILSFVYVVTFTFVAAFHDCIQPRNKNRAKYYFGKSSGGTETYEEAITSVPLACSGGACVGQHRGPHEGGNASYPVGNPIVGFTFLNSTMMVPGYPQIIDRSMTYYIWTDIFFGDMGDGRMNQFVPQLVLGSALSGSSGFPNYNPEFHFHDTYKFGAHYFFEIFNQTSQSVEGKAAYGKMFDAYVGEILYTSFEAKVDDVTKKVFWTLTMGAMNDTSRTSTLVVKEPYMGLLRNETDSWMDINYTNLCINACWELYGATSLARFPSTGSQYHLHITKNTSQNFPWIEQWDQDEGDQSSCARSIVRESHEENVQDVYWNVFAIHNNTDFTDATDVTDATDPINANDFDKRYSVKVINRALGPDGGSIISSINRTSQFRSNFNAAWLPLPNNQGGGLFVRVTDSNVDTTKLTVAHRNSLGKGCTQTSPASNQSHSRIAFVPAVDNGKGLKFAYVDISRLVVPVAPSLDPRAIFRPLTNKSYLTYQCNVAHGDTLLRKTFVASTSNPNDLASWRDEPNPMFPDNSEDCGTCLWFPDDDLNYAMHDSSIPVAHALVTFGGLRGGNITLAVSKDGLQTWSAMNTLLSVRPNHWDNRTLSSAACPRRLSDGNWLFLYNVDNKWPVANPGKIPPYGRCALGWAILSRNNVSHILARSEEPLLFASEPYDMNPENGAPSVYTDGIREEGNDIFTVFVGGQDQVVEAVRIKVYMSS